jgi:hypothetical protein
MGDYKKQGGALSGRGERYDILGAPLAAKTIILTTIHIIPTMPKILTLVKPAVLVTLVVLTTSVILVHIPSAWPTKQILVLIATWRGARTWEGTQTLKVGIPVRSPR